MTKRNQLRKRERGNLSRKAEGQETEEKAQKTRDDASATPRKKTKVQRFVPDYGELEAEAGSQGIEEMMRIPPPRAPAGLPPAFHHIKHFRLRLTPREPRRVLQIKRALGTAPSRGISMAVEVVGFGTNYTERLNTLNRERQYLPGDLSGLPVGNFHQKAI